MSIQTSEDTRSIKFGPMKLTFKKDSRVLFFYSESSSIAAMAYNQDTQELHVTFSTSKDVCYTYYGVPRKLVLKVFDSSSVGSAFAKLIRNTFEFVDTARK